MKPTFTAAVSGDTLEIRVYGPIGMDLFGGGISADQFARELDQARGTFKRLLVRVNSPGGSAYDGMAIRSQLIKLQGVEKVCEIEGLAASAGSLVAMGCDRVVMHTGSALMIHEARAMFDGGDTSKLKKVLAGLEALNDGMASVYASRTGLSKEECRALMEAETWLTPEQAVEQKFADEVVSGDVATAAAFDLSAYGYRNVPAQLLAAAATAHQQPDDAGKDKHMSDFLALIAADLGLTASADPASVAAAVQQQLATLKDLRAQVEVDSNAKLVGAVRGLMESAKQVPALQAKVAEQAKSIEDQKRQAIFAADAADPQGRKITPAMQKWLATQPLEVLEGFMANASHVVQVQSSGQPSVSTGAGPTAVAQSGEVMTHEGKAYEALSPAERHNLNVDHPEQFQALRANWESRGKPQFTASREQRASA